MAIAKATDNVQPISLESFWPSVCQHLFIFCSQVGKAMALLSYDPVTLGIITGLQKAIGPETSAKVWQGVESCCQVLHSQ